jgi:DNA-binding transcriptional regulator YiaG
MDRFFASDAEAARSFGVTERTIRNWSNGVTRPGYLEAVHALTLDPRAVPYLTGVSDEL